MNLQCPISGVKIVDPVSLPGCEEVYDRRSVLEKIESELHCMFIVLYGYI